MSLNIRYFKWNDFEVRALGFAMQGLIVIHGLPCGRRDGEWRRNQCIGY